MADVQVGHSLVEPSGNVAGGPVHLGLSSLPPFFALVAPAPVSPTMNTSSSPARLFAESLSSSSLSSLSPSLINAPSVSSPVPSSSTGPCPFRAPGDTEVRRRFQIVSGTATRFAQGRSRPCSHVMADVGPSTTAGLASPDFHSLHRSSHVFDTRYRREVPPEPKSSGSWDISDANIQVCSSSLSLARSASASLKSLSDRAEEFRHCPHIPIAPRS